MTTTTDAADAAPTQRAAVDAAPAPAPAPAPQTAPPAAPAPAGAGDPAPIRDEAALREFQARHAETKRELAALKARDKAAANAAHWTEHDELKAFKAERLVADAAAEREVIRTGNANAILAGVNPAMRDDVALMLTGMQAAGTIDLYNKTDGAAAKLREQLQADRPAWFSEAADVPSAGMMGAPGLTHEGGGPNLASPNAMEALAGMNDVQFAGHYVKPKNTGPAKL